ncbi:hypothetical protein RHO13_09705 [Orbus wheelerorum]|uniref:hypothetical protein n=1 Tax=Orbus wheelerorum TaxID=3074111 RepID=UPI00370D0391
MATLPVPAPFYDWIDSSQRNKTYMKNALNWPLEGTLFNVEHNGFWLPKQWGTNPKTMIECLTIAKKNIKHMPKLVPTYSHRYLANTNSDQLSPVLSIYQADIIYYGKICGIILLLNLTLNLINISIYLVPLLFLFGQT